MLHVGYSEIALGGGMVGVSRADGSQQVDWRSLAENRHRAPHPRNPAWGDDPTGSNLSGRERVSPISAWACFSEHSRVARGTARRWTNLIVRCRLSICSLNQTFLVIRHILDAGGFDDSRYNFANLRCCVSGGSGYRSWHICITIYCRAYGETWLLSASCQNMMVPKVKTVFGQK